MFKSHATRIIVTLLAIAAIGTAMPAQVTPTGAKLSVADQAGILYASNFGQWQIPAGNLGQYSWNNGSYCQPTVGTIYPGITINGFTTGTPVEIVDTDTPAHDEIVTPTAVTIVPGPAGSCSINIAPIYGHNHFYFTSATGGLQEAINWAGTATYVVYLTPDWVLLGGTTGTITAAQGNYNVSLLDSRTASTLTAYAWNGSQYIPAPFAGPGCIGGNLIANGCTGATTAAGARASLGVLNGPTDQIPISTTGCDQSADINSGFIWGTTTPAPDAAPCLEAYYAAHKVAGRNLVFIQDGVSAISGLRIIGDGWGIKGSGPVGMSEVAISGGSVTGGTGTANYTGKQPIAGQALLMNGFSPQLAVNNVAENGAGNTLTIGTDITTPMPSNFLGSTVTFSNIATATWLNGVTVTVATVTGQSFTATYSHTAYGPASDSGQVQGADGWINYIANAGQPGSHTPIIVSATGLTSSQFQFTTTHGNTTIGAGWGTTLIGPGFFVINGSNSDAISNLPTQGNVAWPPLPLNGGLSISDIIINGNRGNGTNGNSTTGTPQGNNSTGWYFDLHYANLNNVHIEHNLFFNSPSFASVCDNSENIWDVDNSYYPFLPHDQVYANNTDGDHYDGGCSFVHIVKPIYRTGDDGFAVNAPEGYGFPIHDVDIDSPFYDGAQDVGRIYSGSQTPPSGRPFASVTHVHVHGCSGYTNNGGFILGAPDAGFAAMPVLNALDDITIDNCSVSTPGVVPFVVIGDNTGTFTLSHSGWLDGARNHGMIVTQQPGSTATLTINDLELDNNFCTRTTLGQSCNGLLDLHSGWVNSAWTTATVNHYHAHGFRVVDEGVSLSAVPYLTQLTYPSVIVNSDVSDIDWSNITNMADHPAQINHTYSPPSIVSFTAQPSQLSDGPAYPIIGATAFVPVTSRIQSFTIQVAGTVACTTPIIMAVYDCPTSACSSVLASLAVIGSISATGNYGGSIGPTTFTGSEYEIPANHWIGFSQVYGTCSSYPTMDAKATLSAY